MQLAHSADTDAYPFEINRIGGVAGAEIIDLDLSKPIDSTIRDAIMRAFLEHHVLVFRDQDLTKDQQAAFSKNFGTLERHVGRLPNGDPFPIVHTVTNLGSDGKPLNLKLAKPAAPAIANGGDMYGCADGHWVLGVAHDGQDLPPTLVRNLAAHSPPVSSASAATKRPISISSRSTPVPSR